MRYFRRSPSEQLHSGAMSEVTGTGASDASDASELKTLDRVTTGNF